MGFSVPGRPPQPTAIICTAFPSDPYGGVGQALPRGGDGQAPGGGVEIRVEHFNVQGVV